MDEGSTRKHDMGNMRTKFSLGLSCACYKFSNQWYLLLTIFNAVVSKNQCLNTTMKCIAVRFWFIYP